MGPAFHWLFGSFVRLIQGGFVSAAGFDCDSAFKPNFTHPKMIRALAQFLPPQPDDINVDDRQSMATEKVSKSPQQHQQDLLWKAFGKEAGIAVFLALEFQSTVNRFMSLRMNACCSLLLEQLVRR